MTVSIYLIVDEDGESAEYILCLECMEEIDDEHNDVMFLERTSELCERCGEGE